MQQNKGNMFWGMWTLVTWWPKTRKNVQFCLMFRKPRNFHFSKYFAQRFWPCLPIPKRLGPRCLNGRGVFTMGKYYEMIYCNLRNSNGFRQTVQCWFVSVQNRGRKTTLFEEHVKQRLWPRTEIHYLEEESSNWMSKLWPLVCRSFFSQLSHSIFGPY